MMAQSAATAFATLAALDRRARKCQTALPAVEEARQQWAGVGFRLGARRLVAPLDEVSEILTYPMLSPIPHTKPWVRGIANVRGNLLPVMDLGGFLGRHSALVTRLTRVMVIQQENVHAGLLVDEVLGMRHFFDEEQAAVPGDVSEELRPFVTGAFARDDSSWLLFSMRALAAHPQFLKVAG